MCERKRSRTDVQPLTAGRQLPDGLNSERCFRHDPKGASLRDGVGRNGLTCFREIMALRLRNVIDREGKDVRKGIPGRL